MKKIAFVGLVPFGFISVVFIFFVLGQIFGHLESKGHEATAAAESARLAEIALAESEKVLAKERAAAALVTAERAKVVAAERAERDRLAAIERAKEAAVQAEADKLALAEQTERAAADKVKADALAAERAAEREKEKEDKRAKEQAKQYEQIAIKMAKHWITGRLNYPDTASFNWDQSVGYHEGYAYNPERWVVSGSVQSSNAFGVPSTNAYRVCLVKEEKEKTIQWKVWWCEFGGSTYRDPDYVAAQEQWEKEN